MVRASETVFLPEPVRLLVAACLILQSLVLGGPSARAAGLAELKVNFVAEINRVISEYEESRPGVDKVYRRDLHGLQIKSMETGSRDLVDAVRVELERFLIEQHVPQEIPEQTPDAIAELQRDYYRRLIDLLNKRDLEIVGVADTYEKALKKLKAGLSGGSARLIDLEIQQIKANPHVDEARSHVVFVSKRRSKSKPRNPVVSNRPPSKRRVVEDEDSLDEDSPDENVAVFVRPQSDARTRQQYYVGRWVWIAAERRWQREILVFNQAPRPANGHKIWDYVRSMREPPKPGLRPWDNYGYKRFTL